MSTATDLQIITPTDGEGTNCHHRALAALSVFPELRAVIGSLLIQGCRDLRTGQLVGWAKPWGHHVWLVEPDGTLYDPSISNLAHWERVQEMALPRPWDELPPCVITDPQQQAHLVGRITAGRPTPPMPELVYLPGLVYSSNVEEQPSSPAYVTAWGRLAQESVKAGGWDASQLEGALARVEGLMAGPPKIRSTKVARHARRRSAQGFGQGVGA